MKKNLAVIGYGGQGGWHADHAMKSDVLNLSGIYDIKEERNRLAESRGIRVYASLEEVLTDPTVDIVTVATPNDSHREIAVRALLAGKHVVCEKPVEMSLEPVDKMIAAAREAGRLFTVHQNRRWDVDFLAVRNLIADGVIGKPIRIESRIHGSRGIPSDWRGEKAHGGGMILDWGVHLIDQMLQLIPDGIRRVACTVTNITNHQVDDGFRLEILFEGGVSAYIEVGTFNFIALPRFYLQAEKGTAIVEDWRKPAHVVLCKHWHESDVVPVQTAAGITKTMAPRDSVTVDEFDRERPASDVHDFYRNFVRAINGEEELLVNHREIRRVMQVMLAAFRSSETGLPVDFPESI